MWFHAKVTKISFLYSFGLAVSEPAADQRQTIATITAEILK